jgi:hypothetical protein
MTETSSIAYTTRLFVRYLVGQKDYPESNSCSSYEADEAYV